MPDKVFKGNVSAKIIEVRFALSGKTSKILKKTGDTVRKGELLASLDKGILQTNLDRQLADYEKTRADFEIFNLKNPQISDDLSKYLKTEKQAQLNASVKEVELAKIRLDGADLFSPVDGIILDDSNLIPNLYVTSSSNPFKIIDTSSFFLEIEVKQEEISFFSDPKMGKIDILGLEKQDSAKTTPVLTDGKKFYLKIDILNKKNLLLGMEGKITFKE